MSYFNFHIFTYVATVILQILRLLNKLRDLQDHSKRLIRHYVPDLNNSIFLTAVYYKVERKIMNSIERSLVFLSLRRNDLNFKIPLRTFFRKE